jgi:hypothetical protein
MYNLTFDNPYNREIVRKLKSFRNKQQGHFIPTNIEPEHITHQYDPITITGGGLYSGGASSYHVAKKLSPHYPADLFEPRYTLNSNKMVGNRLKGGNSDFYNEPFYNSGTSYDRKDNLVNDLGAVHSKRREKAIIKTGGKKKVECESESDSESDNEKKPKKNVLDKLKKMKGGKKPKKEKKETTSKLLKIFN